MKRFSGLVTISGALAAAGVYGRWVEPVWLRVRRETIPLPNLPPAFDGYRIVQLSDIHLGIPLSQRYLSAVVAVANRERPDLIAFTGDLTTARRDEIEAGGDVLAGLRAPDGVWAVLGNHDYYGGVQRVADVFEAAGIRLLVNEHHVLRRGDDRLLLAGIDDVVQGMPDLGAALAGAPPHAPVILLAHEPDFAYVAAADPRIALQLSGHTHGGQVRLPRFGALILPKLGRSFPMGLHRVRHVMLYVTTGIGTGYFVFRFNCRPEIAVLTLVRGPRAWLPPRNHVRPRP